ncbi:hypothetical protein D3C74_326810 [compost metagenome]
MGRQDCAGKDLAAAGVDLAVFVLDTVHHKSANGCDCQRPVRADGAHHGAERINMGAEGDAPRGITAGQSQDRTALFVKAARHAQRFGFTLNQRHDPTREPAWAWRIQQGFQ